MNVSNEVQKDISLESIYKILQQKRGKQLFLKSQKKTLEELLRTLRRKVRDELFAETIIQKVALETQAEVQVYVSDLISLALSSIYDDAYEFKLSFETKRGRTQCFPLFCRDGKVYAPGKETGGGPVDIASFALRISLWALNKNKINNTIILDEPVHFLDDDARPKMMGLLKRLSKELGIQFIIVTHDPLLIEGADKIIRIKK